jgi:cold-inducible RNA-binding protein
MTQKLFVGNIPYDINESDLKSIFEEGGRTVTEVKIITDRFTGKSRGFGFISYDSESIAEEAIQAFNGRQVGGRTLKVAVAKRKDRVGGGRGPRRPRDDEGYGQSSYGDSPASDFGEGSDEQ